MIGLFSSDELDQIDQQYGHTRQPTEQAAQPTEQAARQPAEKSDLFSEEEMSAVDETTIRPGVLEDQLMNLTPEQRKKLFPVEDKKEKDLAAAEEYAQYWLQTAKNLPGSGWEAVKEVGNILNPLELPNNLKAIGGIMIGLYDLLAKHSDLMQGAEENFAPLRWFRSQISEAKRQEARAMVAAIGNYYKESYGSWDAFAEHFQEDPVSIALDVLSVIDIAGIGLRVAGKTALTAGKAGRIRKLLEARRLAKLKQAEKLSREASRFERSSEILRGVSETTGGAPTEFTAGIKRKVPFIQQTEAAAQTLGKTPAAAVLRAGSAEDRVSVLRKTFGEGFSRGELGKELGSTADEILVKSAKKTEQALQARRKAGRITRIENSLDSLAKFGEKVTATGAKMQRAGAKMQRAAYAPLRGAGLLTKKGAQVLYFLPNFKVAETLGENRRILTQWRVGGLKGAERKLEKHIIGAKTEQTPLSQTLGEYTDAVKFADDLKKEAVLQSKAGAKSQSAMMRKIDDKLRSIRNKITVSIPDAEIEQARKILAKKFPDQTFTADEIKKSLIETKLKSVKKETLWNEFADIDPTLIESSILREVTYKALDNLFDPSKTFKTAYGILSDEGIDISRAQAKVGKEVETFKKLNKAKNELKAELNRLAKGRKGRGAVQRLMIKYALSLSPMAVEVIHNGIRAAGWADAGMISAAMIALIHPATRSALAGLLYNVPGKLLYKYSPQVTALAIIAHAMDEVSTNKEKMFRESPFEKYFEKENVHNIPRETFTQPVRSQIQVTPPQPRPQAASGPVNPATKNALLSMINPTYPFLPQNRPA